MDPAEIGRKIKTAYPVYKDIPDELLGARVIQKFPSMGVESSLDIRKKELDIEKAERENKPLNPNQYLNITPSPIERPPLESFVVKDTTFQGGQKPFIQKEVKKGKEAASGFRQGGREDSALKEEKEAEILASYLPKQLSDFELESIIDETISQTGATQISDMGKVIGVIMGKVAGQADGGRVSGLVKEKLGRG